MEIFHSIILGAVQGITEFLPISSSGHLILVRQILGEQVSYGLAYDAVLQLATTLAIAVYFRREIFDLIKSFLKLLFWKVDDERQKRTTLAIIVGTIPAVLFGLLFENQMETIFRDPRLVAVTMFVGAVIMFFADWFGKQDGPVSIFRGFIIGLFQALAIIPGMSRSGMTISGGLFSGLKREDAAQFSFLLAFPILLGSGLKKILDLGADGLLGTIGIPILIGSIVAFIVGLAAIHFLITYLRKNTLKIFIWYRVVVSIILFFFVF